MDESIPISRQNGQQRSLWFFEDSSPAELFGDFLVFTDTLAKCAGENMPADIEQSFQASSQERFRRGRIPAVGKKRDSILQRQIADLGQMAIHDG